MQTGPFPFAGKVFEASERASEIPGYQIVKAGFEPTGVVVIFHQFLDHLQVSQLGIGDAGCLQNLVGSPVGEPAAELLNPFPQLRPFQQLQKPQLNLGRLQFVNKVERIAEPFIALVRQTCYQVKQEPYLSPFPQFAAVGRK